MSILEAVITVGTVFGLFFLINFVIYRIKKNRKEFLNTLPIEYFECDKKWWKNW